MTRKRHRNVLADTKGYRMLNSRVFSRAKNARAKAGTNAYIGRKLKKRDFRALWNVRINSAVRPLGMTYSTFIGALARKRIMLDRKALSNMAILYPEVFKRVVETVC